MKTKVIEDGRLSMKQINENLYPEDKAKLAVTNEVPFSTVACILNGNRNHRTKAGRKIMAGAMRLAKCNIEYKAKKALIDLSPSPEPVELVDDDSDYDTNDYRERNFECGGDDL